VSSLRRSSLVAYASNDQAVPTTGGGQAALSVAIAMGLEGLTAPSSPQYVSLLCGGPMAL